MIIVSQDKTMILNFENIEVIGIGNPLEDKDGKFKILIETTSDNQYPIAEYNTEEKAKEIIQKIYCKYEHSKHLLSSKSISVQNITDYDFIYEMPQK